MARRNFGSKLLYEPIVLLSKDLETHFEIGVVIFIHESECENVPCKVGAF